MTMLFSLVTMLLPVLLVSTTLFLRSSAIRIISTAPVNPVDQHGVFAIHCHIWDLLAYHQVSIYRTLEATGKYELLSVDNFVQPNVADGTFLAVRQMSDSSKVYFLTIGGVSKSDEGRYTCMVSRPPQPGIIAEESIEMRVLYFPSDNSLACSALQSSTTLYEGVPARFNCSSESGNPVVTIEWKQTGSDRKTLATRQITSGNTVFSVLTFTPRLEDDKAVLICEIKSSAFPNPTGSRTCHIGPITVKPNKSYTGKPVYIPTSHTPTSLDTNINIPGVTNTNNNTLADCSHVCTNTASYWIIATIFLSVIAFIFFAIAITLSVKYCHLTVDDQTDYIGPYATRRVQTIPRDISDKLYVEVEHKRDNGRMYMSLQRPVKDTQRPPGMPGATLNNNGNP